VLEQFDVNVVQDGAKAYEDGACKSDVV